MQQDEIWESPDWWRVGALRHPYARTYSAFENRILMQAPSVLKDEVWEFCSDDRIDGNIARHASAISNMFAVEEHGRLVLLTFSNDHYAIH